MSPSHHKSDRRGGAQIAIDVSLAVALLLVLLITFGADRVLNPASSETPDNQIQEVVIAPTEKSPNTLRLGVTPDSPEFDNMGGLLDVLGEGYKYHPFPLDDLLDERKIIEYDIIFLTCSGYTPAWLAQQTGKGPRGSDLFAPNRESFRHAKESLRKFVGKGGTLYASDLHFNLIAECFDEFVDSAVIDIGEVQTVQAEVVDPGLRETIGSHIELRFDQPSWRPAAFRGKGCTTYLRGQYQSQQGSVRSAPFLVKFPFQEGNVIFTSFHNEKQNNETELKLLRYLVFTAVTANVESQVTKTMMRGGFAPAKQNLFSTSSGERSVSQTYTCTKPGDLQFVLGFADQGARLKLAVTGPDGKEFEKEGTSTVTIDVPGASVGAWKYSVSALALPNENFAYTVTVGQK